MDFAAVQAVLNDLPLTFKRPGTPYTQVIDSEAAALSLWTDSSDGMAAQLNFADATAGWLDAWGLLIGVPRNTGEGDGPYTARISATVLAWFCTVPALEAYVALFGSGGSVTENFPAVGYTITLPSTMTPVQVGYFFAGLPRIRPAGIPFSVKLGGSGGLYLGTQVYFGVGVVEGSYLISTGPDATGLGEFLTKSAKTLLPTLLLTDPILNPGV